MSAATFKNIIVHFIRGNQIEKEEMNVNDLLMKEENKFSGWECWAGIQNITIDNQGDVWRAICRQGGKLGNIHDGFEVPVDTVICAKEFCNCAADLQLTKSLPEFKSNVRAGRK